MPGVIRSYEANQFNHEYHKELNRDTTKNYEMFQKQ